jgi:glycosyltransferase involved in cell wall biosynthesis
MPEEMSLSHEKILVTAVITTYNRPQLVRRAIRSVVAQTYEPLEIIVVEDGSESGVEAWLQDEGLNLVRYVRHGENKGLAASRNTGLKLASGEYVAYLDDDDEWKPEHIERQMQQLAQLPLEERDRLGVIYCGHEVHFAGRSRISIAHPRNEGILREAIMRQGAVTLGSTCLFSKAALQKVGGFDEMLPSSIDDDIWMALATHEYEAQILDEPLVVSYEHHFRRRMTSSAASRIQGVRRYVEKWEPTYQAWFGETAGTKYGQRYFARVVATLAAAKLVVGDLAEAWQAVRAIFIYSTQTGYNLLILLRSIAVFGAYRFLPDRIINLLKTIKR